jgi:hypothetical protein
VGKFFFSRQFAQINSLNFVRRPVPLERVFNRGGREFTRQIWFEQTGYINLGLLYGVRRSSELVSTNDVADARNGLAQRMKHFLASAPVCLRDGLFVKFLRHHWTTLESVRVPWFIPASFGGVGLPTLLRATDPDEPLEYIYGPSDIDRRCAARIRERPDLYQPRQKLNEGFWDINRLFWKRLPVQPELGNWTKKDKQNFDRLYNLMTVDTIFSVESPFSLKESNTHANLRYNERLWKTVLRKGNLPPPLGNWALVQGNEDLMIPLTFDSLFNR